MTKMTTTVAASTATTTRSVMTTTSEVSFKPRGVWNGSCAVLVSSSSMGPSITSLVVDGCISSPCPYSPSLLYYRTQLLLIDGGLRAMHDEIRSKSRHVKRFQINLFLRNSSTCGSWSRKTCSEQRRTTSQVSDTDPGRLSEKNGRMRIKVSLSRETRGEICDKKKRFAQICLCRLAFETCRSTLR